MAATQSRRKMPLPSMRIIDDPLICADEDRQNAPDDQRGRAAKAEDETQKPHRSMFLPRFGGSGIRRAVLQKIVERDAKVIAQREELIALGRRAAALPFGDGLTRDVQRLGKLLLRKTAFLRSA